MTGGHLAFQFPHEPAGDGFRFARRLAGLLPGARVPPAALRLEQFQPRIRLAQGQLVFRRDPARRREHLAA